MAYFDYKEMVDQAREHFIEGHYALAEPMLQQALLKNDRDPEIYHMMATISYDRGQFNRAIRTFKKALAVDPTYTDSSVGLSIVLNDLGRYEEAKDIFSQAETALEKAKTDTDPYIEQKLFQKHRELGDLYMQINKFDEALDQYYKAKKLSTEKISITLKIVDCLIKTQRIQKGIQELQLTLREYPNANEARLKLGTIYYQRNRTYEAVEEWEKILIRDPKNSDAKKLIQLAKEAGITDIIAD